LRLGVRIAALCPLLIAVGATSSILEMTPPIRGLALGDLRDMFAEVHNGHPHEAIDIMEPRGTPVRAVVSHLNGYAEGLREGMQVESGDVIGFVGSTGNADPSAPHLHFAIFELGPEKQWWKGKAVDPYPGLVAAVKRER
jgi:murein DD-endopeptidase MepM/ murein hydrolase activator NlpD